METAIAANGIRAFQLISAVLARWVRIRNDRLHFGQNTPRGKQVDISHMSMLQPHKQSASSEALVAGTRYRGRDLRRWRLRTYGEEPNDGESKTAVGSTIWEKNRNVRENAAALGKETITSNTTAARRCVASQPSAVSRSHMASTILSSGTRSSTHIH